MAIRPHHTRQASDSSDKSDKSENSGAWRIAIRPYIVASRARRIMARIGREFLPFNIRCTTARADATSITILADII